MSSYRQMDNFNYPGLQNDVLSTAVPSERRMETREEQPWMPIKGVDTSVWHYDPVRQKNTLRTDFASANTDTEFDHRYGGV